MAGAIPDRATAAIAAADWPGIIPTSPKTVCPPGSAAAGLRALSPDKPGRR